MSVTKWKIKIYLMWINEAVHMLCAVNVEFRVLHGFEHAQDTLSSCIMANQMFNYVPPPNIVLCVLDKFNCCTSFIPLGQHIQHCLPMLTADSNTFHLFSCHNLAQTLSRHKDIGRQNKTHAEKQILDGDKCTGKIGNIWKLLEEIAG